MVQSIDNGKNRLSCVLALTRIFQNRLMFRAFRCVFLKFDPIEKRQQIPSVCCLFIFISPNGRWKIANMNRATNRTTDAEHWLASGERGARVFP